MWAGVAYGCCLSVGEFKKVARKYFCSGGELLQNLNYFKKFQVFDF